MTTIVRPTKKVIEVQKLVFEQQKLVKNLKKTSIPVIYEIQNNITKGKLLMRLINKEKDEEEDFRKVGNVMIAIGKIELETIEKEIREQKKILNVLRQEERYIKRLWRDYKKIPWEERRNFLINTA
jgi:hypothetical protein